MSGTADRRPLDGVRVVDLTSVLMGPYATQILGDLGADVVVVEHPEGRSINRHMCGGAVAGLSGIAMNLLRNKRSICLDLKSADGRAELLALCARADVFVTNLRRSTLARLKLGYPDLSGLQPRGLVYCQAQGWAADTPGGDDPAYDDVIQADSGIADLFARATGDPRYVPSVIADKICGMAMANAVLAALLHREKTGHGQLVELAMADAVRSFLLVEHIGEAATVPPIGEPGYQRLLNAERRPYRTADDYISVMPYTVPHWNALFAAGGRADLVDDPWLASPQSRAANAGKLYAALGEVLVRRTTAEWMAFCGAYGIPATPVRPLSDVVTNLPVATHPRAGQYRVIPPPARFSAAPNSTVWRHAPLPGENSDEVRRQWHS